MQKIRETEPIDKIAYLDGLRGLAAFLVFFHHFLLIFCISYYSFNPATVQFSGWEIKYGRSILSVLSNGNFFVCVFFVLSGFVLSRKYLTQNKVSVLVSGMQRRYIRLYVPVAFTLVLSYVLMAAHLYRNTEVAAITSSDWFAGQWHLQDGFRTLVNCLLYDTMFQGNSSFDNVMWSLSTELYGSVFVFAFLALTHNTRPRFILLLLVMLFWLSIRQFYMFTFGLGIALNFLLPLKTK